jgi:two-component system phosphate regulon sensor histidine kinase PhoR
LTFFIIIVSATAIYQIIQQKKVSEMKSDFINNMSHEFKTPIATINLALDAISNTKILSTPSKVKQYVQMIREENKRMLTQVESVLLISRLEKSSAPIAFSDIDLNEAIHNAIRHVDLLLKSKKGSISTSFEASDTIFKGNLNHITNLIINLLDNSIKYSDNPPKIRIATSNTNKHLVFTIEDSGIGMDLTTQKFVFEKFYRVQSGNIHNIKGHGLGLSYVKKIVDLHNGSIDLFSNVGKGTAFTISFPKK